MSSLALPFLKARLVSKTKEYDQVVTYRLKPEKPLQFVAGQYAHVLLPGMPSRDRVRELSFASSPGEDEVMLTVDLASGSAFKQQLDSLKPGEFLQLFKIKGEFTLPEVDQQIVFISGGIGLTPVQALLHEITATGRDMQPVIVHVATGDFLYKKELEALPYEQHRIRRVEVEPTLSLITKQNPEALYYVSGSPSFIEAIDGQLDMNGIGERQVKHDTFKGYKEGARDDDSI